MNRVHTKTFLMMKFMKSIMDVLISSEKERKRGREEERDVTVVFSVAREFGGPSVILIKRIFISEILICMAQAIRVREGRNEQGENE